MEASHFHKTLKNTLNKQHTLDMILNKQENPTQETLKKIITIQPQQQNKKPSKDDYYERIAKEKASLKTDEEHNLFNKLKAKRIELAKEQPTVGKHFSIIQYFLPKHSTIPYLPRHSTNPYGKTKTSNTRSNVSNLRSWCYEAGETEGSASKLKFNKILAKYGEVFLGVIAK
jgi:hypothetical protein